MLNKYKPVRYFKYSCLMIALALVAVSAASNHEHSRNGCAHEWDLQKIEPDNKEPDFGWNDDMKNRSECCDEINDCKEYTENTSVREATIHEPPLIISGLFFWLR
jgi:hypothetical protein